jgi:hypothetical protein
MRSHGSLTSTQTSPKLLPLALSALITFGPLIYLANHSFKSDKMSTIQQVVEMRLLEDLIKPIPLPKQPVQQVVPNAVLLPSSVVEPLGNIKIENSITQAPLPPEVAEPKTLNLSVPSRARDSTNKISQSPVKQLIEDESAKVARKQTEKFANAVKNSAKPDCLKNDYGLGLFNVVPLIYDIAKDRCH